MTDLLNNFLEYQLTKIPWNHNLHAHSLATFASTYKLPFGPNHQSTAEIKHRPSFPDNVNNWQVFENDTQINNFLTMKEEFSNLNIDTSTKEDQNQKDELNTSISAEIADRILHPTTFDPANLQKLKITDLDEINEEET